MSRDERMAFRREAKFDKHGIIIKEEGHTDHRVKNGKEHTLSFRFAVYRGQQLIGRSWTRRGALKRAHQWVRKNR